MGTRFTVQPNCLGIDGQGLRIDADKTGHFEVNSKEELARVRDSGPYKQGWIEETKTIFTDSTVPGITCPTCAFSAFAFTKVCPRCGTQLGEENATICTI